MKTEKIKRNKRLKYCQKYLSTQTINFYFQNTTPKYSIKNFYIA
ncbi:hypothetical protein DOY81_005239, partial [Sarcophaga bullata]